MRSAVIPAGEHVPTADQRVVMNSVSWAHFESMLRARGNRSAPRMAFLATGRPRPEPRPALPGAASAPASRGALRA